MAEVSLRSFLPLMLVTALLVYEEWVSFPSCKLLSSDPGGASPEDLKVMMVSDLLLLGSEAGFVNHYFSDYYMSKFFRVNLVLCLIFPSSFQLCSFSCLHVF